MKDSAKDVVYFVLLDNPGHRFVILAGQKIDCPLRGPEGFSRWRSTASAAAPTLDGHVTSGGIAFGTGRADGGNGWEQTVRKMDDASHDGRKLGGVWKRTDAPVGANGGVQLLLHRYIIGPTTMCDSASSGRAIAGQCISLPPGARNMKQGASNPDVSSCKN